MSDLRELYQELILDHGKRPRNFGPLPGATHEAIGHNPLCGDKITVYATVEDGRISGISFQGSGCAISKASASLMTDAVKGLDLADAADLFARVQAMVTAPVDQPVEDDSLGKLAALAGVREFPVRVKCATLAWHTLKAALSGMHQTAQTE